MNKSNIDLFKCLLLDLDCDPGISTILTPVVCGELRKNLLTYIENPSESNELTFCESFRKVGVITNLVSAFKASTLYPDVFVAEMRRLYQIVSFGRKIPMEYNAQQKEQYVEKFIDNERETGLWHVNRRSEVSRLARVLMHDLGRSLDLSPTQVGSRLSHGPGAVYDHSVGCDKNFLCDPPADLRLSYDYEVFFANYSLWSEYASTSSYDRSPRHVYARLALVPKDFRGPRGVFVSPKEAVMVQIAQDRCLKDMAARTWLGECYDPYTQIPSQELAYSGSYGGWYATLDLSDASDRVPLSLIAWLFHRTDYVRLARTRASYIDLPNGVRHKLRMFAPMGDGKTFSVLSSVCSVIVVAAMLHHDGYIAARPPSEEVRRAYAQKCRIFGDDIIVEARYYECVVSALELHNLKINKSKSFARGPFRESCGIDALSGNVVTPVYQRFNLDSSDELDPIKWVEFHNRCWRFYPHLKRTIAYIRAVIEARSDVVAYTSNSDRDPTSLLVEGPSYWNYRRAKTHPWQCHLRFNDLHQVVEVRVPCVLNKHLPVDRLDPWWDLNYWLLTKHQPPSAKAWGPARRIIVGSQKASDDYVRMLTSRDRNHWTNQPAIGARWQRM